jgi:AraC-like DNA-binding protein
MRAMVEKVILPAESSYKFEVRDDPCFKFEWHFHSEYELTLILNSRGRRFVGDSIDDYRGGDLVLVGPNLPHTWCSTTDHRRCGRHKAIVVQFADSFLGEGFFARPELQDVGRLLKRSAVGLCFERCTARDYVTRQICRMGEIHGLDRLLALLTVLAQLTRLYDARPLASTKFLPNLNLTNKCRIDRACTYINNNFAESISLHDVARVAHMSPSAFSHFFRRTVGRNFIDYVNEIRVGHSCGLLSGSDWPITQVAYASGFPNLSNFNRRFLRLKKMTPKAYRRQFVDRGLTEEIKSFEPC